MANKKPEINRPLTDLDINRAINAAGSSKLKNDTLASIAIQIIKERQEIARMKQQLEQQTLEAKATLKADYQRTGRYDDDLLYLLEALKQIQNQEVLQAEIIKQMESMMKIYEATVNSYLELVAKLNSLEAILMQANEDYIINTKQNRKDLVDDIVHILEHDYGMTIDRTILDNIVEQYNAKIAAPVTTTAPAVAQQVQSNVSQTQANVPHNIQQTTQAPLSSPMPFATQPKPAPQRRVISEQNAKHEQQEIIFMNDLFSAASQHAVLVPSPYKQAPKKRVSSDELGEILTSFFGGNHLKKQVSFKAANKDIYDELYSLRAQSNRQEEMLIELANNMQNLREAMLKFGIQQKISGR